ncbi:LbtU family siderophore porin [Verrucomicrobiaceae bacterium 227]
MNTLRTTPLVVALATACSLTSLMAESVSDTIFPESWMIDTNVEYSKEMLSAQRTVVNKVPYLLESYRDGLLETGKVYLSGHAIYSYYNEQTDTAGKYPILGRFPEQHSAGRRADESILDTADLSLTYAPSKWVSAYVHGIYTDLSFPSQEEAQIREAFVTFGNLAESPWYLSVGRMTVNFGHQGSYNPVTHSVNNHFFRVDTYDAAAELGYIGENYRFAFTAMNGGRQLRVADNRSSTFGSNFAISGQYDLELAGWDVSVGGGYLYSSIYDSDDANHPGVHSNLEISRECNGLLNVWAEAKKGPISLMGEITQSERDWKASGGPVQGFTLQAAYDTEILSKDTRFSLVYGRGKLGNEGDQWESLHQLAVGMETYLTDNFAISAEYVYNRSFIPLIALDRVADEDVDTDTFILSGTLFF